MFAYPVYTNVCMPTVLQHKNSVYENSVFCKSESVSPHKITGHSAYTCKKTYTTLINMSHARNITPKEKFFFRTLAYSFITRKMTYF